MVMEDAIAKRTTTKLSKPKSYRDLYEKYNDTVMYNIANFIAAIGATDINTNDDQVCNDGQPILTFTKYNINRNKTYARYNRQSNTPVSCRTQALHQLSRESIRKYN